MNEKNKDVLFDGKQKTVSLVVGESGDLMLVL